MNLLGIGSIISGIGSVADDLMTSDEERKKIELETKQVEASLMSGQMAISQVEAKHKSLFVAGGRPAIMWICGFGLAYASIIEPLLRFVALMSGYEGEFPVIDNTLMSQVLIGMLGLGLMRSHDKSKGVQTDKI